MTKNGKLTMLDHIVAAIGSDSLKVGQIVERLGDKYSEGSIRQVLFNHKGYFENPSRGVYKVAATPVIKEKVAKDSSKKVTVANSKPSLFKKNDPEVVALTNSASALREQIKMLETKLKHVESSKNRLLG